MARRLLSAVAMSDLLDLALKAHGGLDRWREVKIVDERRHPRASFAGHVRETPWDQLHRAPRASPGASATTVRTAREWPDGRLDSDRRCPARRRSLRMTHTHATAPAQFVEANRIRFAYRRFGRETREPLLLMQHFRGGMDHWDPAITDGFAMDRR